MTNVPYRIRIELPDRPGALANVASIIASQGGNVVSVDIHDAGGQHAVDEIVVMLPMEWQSDQLAAELAKYDAGTLVSSTSAVVGSDSVVRALRWAASLVRQSGRVPWTGVSNSPERSQNCAVRRWPGSPRHKRPRRTRPDCGPSTTVHPSPSWRIRHPQWRTGCPVRRGYSPCQTIL
jgi:ACT domain